MRAMVLNEPKQPLELHDVPKPEPGRGQLLVRVSTCAVCRTDLHVVDRAIAQSEAAVDSRSPNCRTNRRNRRRELDFAIGDRVGIPWLGWTDGNCAFCRSGRENLCDNARFTGYTIDGGYAEFTVTDARYCFHLPERYDDVEVAPLLCAGLIGYRSYNKTGDAGAFWRIYGFGNAAHLIAQIAIYEGRELFASSPGRQSNTASCERTWRGLGGRFRRNVAGKTRCRDHFCIGRLARPGSAPRTRERRCRRVRRNSHDRHSIVSVCALWEERVITSVANLTRRDGEKFFEIAPRVPVRTHTEKFSLEEANIALDRFREGKLKGTAVLVVNAVANP